MKKILSALVILAVAMSLVACTGKVSSSASSSVSSKITITYTKEFSYFPSYSGMNLSKYTVATKKAPLAEARYTIKNSADSKVFNYYVSALKQDGWTISDSKKYSYVTAKKDKHMANILIQKSGKDILLIVMSK